MKEFNMKALEVDANGTAWYSLEGIASWLDGLEDDVYDGEYGLSKDCTQMLNRQEQVLLQGKGEIREKLRILNSLGNGVHKIVDNFPLYYIFDELPKVSYVVKSILDHINPLDHDRWVVTVEYNNVTSFTDTKTGLTGSLENSDLVVDGVFIECRQYGYFDDMTLTYDESVRLNSALREYKLDSVKYRKGSSQSKLEGLYCKGV